MTIHMLKEKLFKLLFPRKAKEIVDRKKSIDQFYQTEWRLQLQIKELQEKQGAEPTTAQITEYCLKTLNIPYIEFANVDDNGKPPHYLAGLSDVDRKNFVASMESMYADEKFQKIVSYVINLIGNHAIQKASDDQMKNGKIGIIGIRTLMAEFINAHQEYVDSKKSVEGFDPLATLPE